MNHSHDHLGQGDDEIGDVGISHDVPPLLYALMRDGQGDKGDRHRGMGTGRRHAPLCGAELHKPIGAEASRLGQLTWSATAHLIHQRCAPQRYGKRLENASSSVACPLESWDGAAGASSSG